MRMLQSFIADALIHRQVNTLCTRLWQFVGRLCRLGVRILRFLICGVQRQRTTQQNQRDYLERLFHSHLTYSSKNGKRRVAESRHGRKVRRQLAGRSNPKGPCSSVFSAALAVYLPFREPDERPILGREKAHL